MDNLATNPQGGEAVIDAQVDTTLAPQGVDTDALDNNLDDADLSGDLDPDNPTGAGAEGDDAEEVEYEGQQYKVPKVLKEALLRQADYTRKTQEVAAFRQDLEGRQQAFQQQIQLEQAVATERVQLATLDQQIALYTDEVMRDLAVHEPERFNLAQYELGQLQKQRQALEGQIGQKQTQALDQQRQAAATQIRQASQVLHNDIKDWPTVGPQVFDYGQQAHGFTPQELGQVADPRMIKVLHKAYLYDQAEKAKTQARRVQQAQRTQPVNTVRGEGGRFTPAADTSDFAAFEKDADRRMGRKG